MFTLVNTCIRRCAKRSHRHLSNGGVARPADRPSSAYAPDANALRTILLQSPSVPSATRRKVILQYHQRRLLSTSNDSADKNRPDSNGDTSNDTNASPTEKTKSFLISLNYTPAVSQGVIDALLQNGIPQSSLPSMVRGLAGRYEVGEDGGLEALAASVQHELDKDDGGARVRVVCLPSTGWSPAPPEGDGDGEANDGQQHNMPRIVSMDRAFAVEAAVGTTLTDVAKFGTSENCDVLGEYLECACAGIMACSTCHVVIHPDWYDATMAASDADNGGDDDDRSDGGAPSTCTSTNVGKVGPPSEAEQDMIDLAYEPQLTSRLGCQIKLTRELDGLVILLPRGSNNLMDFVPFE